MKTWKVLIVVAVVAGLCLFRCSDGPEPGEASGSGFDRLVAEYGETLEQLPEGENFEEAIGAIAAAAVREGRIPGKDARVELIGLFPDSTLGLYLFEEARMRLDGAAVEQLVSAIESEAPGTGVDAAAFDWRLSKLGPEDVVAACSTELERAGADATRRGRVALYRRAIGLREMGQRKQAALDVLRLCSLHWDAVTEMDAAGYVCATLEDAGLLLESDLIEKSPYPGRAAAALWKEFSGAAEASGAGVYFREAPDVAAVEKSASADGPFGRALLCARLARIALEAVEPEEAARRYEGFVDAAGDAVKSGLEEDDAVQLAQTLGVSVLSWGSFMSDGAGLRANLEQVIKRVEPRAASLGGKMLCLYLESWLSTAPAGNDGAEAMLAEVERVVDWAGGARGRVDHETVVGAYNVFLERFPESSQAPDVLGKLADHYQVRMRDSVKAAELYARLISRYPDAPNAEKAVLRHALALYENKEYRGALDSLTSFIEKKPESGNVATARYMAALAEAALGMSDEAEARMTKVVNEYPQSALAPRALYWLGMNHVVKQAYKEAGEVFEMLVDRYPESEYADRGRGYLGNLKK